MHIRYNAILTLILGIIFNFSSFSQISEDTIRSNYLPMHLGNQWQFSVFGNYDGYYSYSLSAIKINRDTSINDNEYYLWNIYGNDYWLRYDNNLKKIFILNNDSDMIYMDFNIQPGESFVQYSGYNFRNVEVKEKIISRFNQIFSSKGFYYDTTTSEEYWEYKYFGSNIGFYFTESGTQMFSHFGYTQYSLIMAVVYDSSGNPEYFTEHYKPEFSISPILLINNAYFVLDFEVNHYWSYFFTPGTPFTGRNFVDTVWMYSHYSNGDSTINQPTVLAINSPGTANPYYSVSTVLDTILMKNGYSFLYRFVAKDKGIIPEYSNSPYNGYYECKWNLPVNINEPSEKLCNYKLEQNYPNPFNPVTNIQYAIGSRQFVTLKIYDVLGNVVATIVNDEKPAGSYTVEFNGINLASGIYFYQLKASGYTATRKLILLK